MRSILITLYVISAVVLVYIVSPFSPLVVPIFYSYSSDSQQQSVPEEALEVSVTGNYELFETIRDMEQEAELIVSGQVLAKEKAQLHITAERERRAANFMAYLISVRDVAKGDVEQSRILLLQECGETAYYDYPLEKEGIFLLVNAANVQEEGQFYQLINPEQGFIGTSVEHNQITYIHLSDELQSLYCSSKAGDKHRLTFQYIWDELASAI